LSQLSNVTPPNGRRSLFQENADLRNRLEEAEETIRAIQQGAVDAFVLEELGHHRVYRLEGAEGPDRLFVERMQQGVATLLADGTILYGNARLSELLGLPHEKLIGCELASFVAEPDRACFAELFEQRDRGSSGEVALQVDGRKIPVFLTFNALPNDQEVTGVFVTDLTMQKSHQELVAAKEMLADADRRKDEFLAMLAHELRNPLAPIRNAVALLRLSNGDGDTVNATCELLERQVGQMVRLVDDLLDVSRITRNKIELRKQRVALSSVIDQAVESIRPHCANLGHQLTVELPSEPIYLDGDPARLTQIFVNLLDNACKYMERGGRISLSTAVCHTATEGSEVVVRIRDNGMGIAPQQIARIFDMFAQVDASLERSRGGLGIGLTLVRNLVEMHGGKVEAHSQGTGKGSEFVVRLPVQIRTALRTQRLAPATPDSTSAKYRILVADDNRDSAESLALLLKLMGHETHIAFDGDEAVQVAENIRPDVILLDLGMPNMNGFDACRAIRGAEWGKSVVVIAQTGWGQDDDRRRTLEAGFDDHLVKPVEPAALMRMLASLADGNR
jgi:PAS domain S-box-containing protein